jgi:c-di-GMP-binding flagellar brake protein YcgR
VEVTGRRRSQRHSIQLDAEVSFTCQDAQEARLCDLSQGGAMLLSPLKAKFGTQVRIRFELAPDTRCEAVGNVLRNIRYEDLNGVAFEFSRMNEAFRHFLQNLDSVSGPERERFLGDIRSLAVEFVAE